MNTLWTHQEASEATGGKAYGAWQATGVSIDSRTAKAGDLFVAITGPNSDGHDYVNSALARGAVAAMVTKRHADWGKNVPLLQVPDANLGLSALGQFARQRLSKTGRIIGVTGSVGKTGIKEALRHCLSQQAPTSATEGNLNNKWGLPLSLARMPASTVYGVFEIGMNCPGEISSLSKILQPEIAVISNVEAVHTEFFDSVDDIASAKAEIFHGMGKNGIAILNRDNRYFAQIKNHAEFAYLSEIISFGSSKNADARLLNFNLETNFSTVEADICGEILKYQIGVPGDHWVLNSLAVLAAVKASGGNILLAAESLREMPQLRGRGECTKISTPCGDFILIDESYNASPVSIRAALKVLSNIQPKPPGRRIAVLGDMLELGICSNELHAGLAEDIEEAGVDIVFTVGNRMAALAKRLPDQIISWHEITSDKIIPKVMSNVRAGDVITIKGSFGSRMGLVADALRALCNDKGENVI